MRACLEVIDGLLEVQVKGQLLYLQAHLIQQYEDRGRGYRLWCRNLCWNIHYDLPIFLMLRIVLGCFGQCIYPVVS